MEVMRIQTTVRRAQFHDMTLGGQIVYPDSYQSESDCTTDISASVSGGSGLVTLCFLSNKPPN